MNKIDLITANNIMKAFGQGIIKADKPDGHWVTSEDGKHMFIGSDGQPKYTREKIEGGSGSLGGVADEPSSDSESKYKVKTSQGEHDLRWDNKADQHKEKFSKLTSEDHAKLSEAHGNVKGENASIQGYHAGMRDYHKEQAGKESKSESESNNKLDGVTDTVSLIKEAAKNQTKKVYMEFHPAYDEKEHGNLSDKLKDSLKVGKKQTLDVIEDSDVILHLNGHKDIKSMKFIEDGSISIKNLAPFEKIIKESKSLDEAFQKVKTTQGVSSEVSKLFREKYDPDGNLSPKKAFEKFYNEVKGSGDDFKTTTSGSKKYHTLTSEGKNTQVVENSDGTSFVIHTKKKQGEVKYNEGTEKSKISKDFANVEAAKKHAIKLHNS